MQTHTFRHSLQHDTASQHDAQHKKSQRFLLMSMNRREQLAFLVFSIAPTVQEMRSLRSSHQDEHLRVFLVRRSQFLVRFSPT